MFSFKFIFSRLFFPVALCLEILILGLVLLWFTRRQRTGKLVVTLGTILLVLLSNYAITDRMLIPLERKYPALINLQASQAVTQDNQTAAKMIVMLGGGHRSDPKLPITDHLSDTALTRLVEAVRLYKELPGSKLILSGGSGDDPLPEAEVLAKVAPVLGVNSQDLILETESVNTEDEARRLKPMLGQEKFILVTSASHMPRAVALFKKQGMNPIPAPAGHLVKGGETYEWPWPFPSSWDLYKAERAVYEYLGLAWAWLLRKI
jgi:uncharacterized SAM-binding protein YcdF (DUF218 family)